MILEDGYRNNNLEDGFRYNNLEDGFRNNNCDCGNNDQTHTHEFSGSTKLAEIGTDPHNHHFAGVTGEAIRVRGGHVHRLSTNTDFCENHFHIVADTTGLQIPVGDGRHVHFVEGDTTLNDGHRHEFIFATLIENPMGD